MNQIPDPATVKSCCASAYATDAVSLILGPSFHPGGLALTRRLADTLALRPGQRVLDVACGPGTTALLLAAEYGARVEGVDYSADLVAKAEGNAKCAGLADRVAFRVGDAEALLFPDASFDAVVCECAFCTFPDKPAAAAEFARVLRHSGKIGITDVTIQTDRLPTALANLTGVIACLADARPLTDYARILDDAGLRTTRTEDHGDDLADMVTRIEARLRLLSMNTTTHPALAELDLERALELTRSAADTVQAGAIGYTLITAVPHHRP